MEDLLLKSGRAAREDGVQTRENLMDAAEELFATCGFRSTSIRGIVDMVGCNIAAVNYHFGGKESLYLEVFRRCVSSLREVTLGRIERLHKDDSPTPTLEIILEAYAEAFIEPLVEDSKGRYIMLLFSRELTDPHLTPEFLLAELVEPIEEALGEVIGSACPNLDAEDVRVCIQLFIAQLVHVLRMQDYFASVGRKSTPLPVSRKTIRTIVRFSAGGVRAMAAADDGTRCSSAQEA